MSQKQKNQWNAKNDDRHDKKKKEKYVKLNKGKKATFLGNKTKRNIEDMHTNDSSIQNRPLSETETYIENEKKNMISYKSSSSKSDKSSKDILNEHANKNKIKIKKGKGFTQFNPKLPFKSGNINKLNINQKKQFNFALKGKSHNTEEREGSDEDISSKNNQIDLIEEESDIKEKSSQKYHKKKKRIFKENQDSDIESNEIKGDNSSDDEENFENKNISNRPGNENYPIVKKNDNNSSIVSREEFNNVVNELKVKIETLETKMIKLSGIQGEINYQNEKYIKNNLCVKIDNLDYKYKVLINSYRVLFIRKLANIFLDEIYERYGRYFQTFEFKYKRKDHKITACIRDLEGVGFHIVNLIVDFLKHIKIRASNIIHMQDKEIKFRKEILFDYLNRELENNSFSTNNYLTLNDAISLVFRSEKEKVLPKKENSHYENMKKIFQKEKENNEHPDKAELKKELKIKDKYKKDNYVDGDEEEEERITKILSGDKNLFETNLSSQLDLLLQKIELNREIVNPVKKLDSLKKINPKFFFDSWKNSFIEEGFKCHETYRRFVDPNNVASVKNLGRYLRELLKGMIIDLGNKDPCKLEKKVEKV